MSTVMAGPLSPKVKDRRPADRGQQLLPCQARRNPHHMGHSLSIEGAGQARGRAAAGLGRGGCSRQARRHLPGIGTAAQAPPTGGHAEVRPGGVVGVERGPRLQADACVLQLGHAHKHAGGAGGRAARQVLAVGLCSGGAGGGACLASRLGACATPQAASSSAVSASSCPVLRMESKRDATSGIPPEKVCMTRRCCGSISSASAGETPRAGGSNSSAPARKDPNCWFSSARGVAGGGTVMERMVQLLGGSNPSPHSNDCHPATSDAEPGVHTAVEFGVCLAGCDA